MGKMCVIEEGHQDKTTNDEKWISVTFKPVATFQVPVSLKAIKATKGLQDIGLIKQPRLSVVKLEPSEFNALEDLIKALQS